MPFNPNVPSTSFGNWMRTGSATYVPPEMTRVGRRDAKIEKLESDLAKQKGKTDSALAIARSERDKRMAERKKRRDLTENKKVDAPAEKNEVVALKEEEKMHIDKLEADLAKKKEKAVVARAIPRSEGDKGMAETKERRDSTENKKVDAPKEKKKADGPKEKKKMVDISTSPVETEGTSRSHDALKKREDLEDEQFQLRATAQKSAKAAAKAEAGKDEVAEDTVSVALEEAAKKKAEEYAAAKREADKAEAAKKEAADEKEAKKRKLADAVAAVKEKSEDIVVKKGRYCCDCGQRNHEGDCDESTAASAINRSVVNNYYIGSKAQKLADLIKSPKETIKTKSDAKVTELEDSPGGRVKFTKEQDAKLLSLKRAGKDAREVSRELGMPKLDVIDRWRELSIMKSRKAQDEAFANESVLPEGDEVIGEATDMNVKDGVATFTFKVYDTALDKVDRGNKDKKQMKSSNYKKPTSEDDKDEPASNFNNKADAKKKSNCSVDFPVYHTRTGQPTSYVPVSYASTVPLRGGVRRLHPDSNFSIKDLEILKEIECRYRELQWHEVAAKFYNKTGRMIDPNVIKAKITESKEVLEDGNQPDTLNIRVNLN